MQDTITTYTPTTQYTPTPDPLMEYTCPEDESNYPYAETQLCENKSMNRGCKHLKNCPAYNKQKKFEQKNPQATWTLTHNKNHNQGYKELHTTLTMIKKEIIIPPTKNNEQT